MKPTLAVIAIIAGLVLVAKWLFDQFGWPVNCGVNYRLYEQ